MSERLDCIRKLFRHVDNCRDKLLRAAERLEKETFLSRRSGMSSIRDLLVHLMDTEDYWVGSVIMGERRRKFSPEKYEDAASIRRDWDGLRDRTKNYVWALSEESLSETRTVELEQERTLEIETVLWQVTTHELHHNGQICLLMRQAGHEPPELDVL
jgi:uncharacterized damage-inducible protein DinB